ncbi:hypothetical protein [Rhizobium sp. GN54]|uniref:hypothetical protein n=1 Tax=Rhizobium sp. GN54 TaxID=2898150 RepID=UPI001E482D14|nr:hypothetical protein [Rhizobium sp. GN54]MCD2184910.1 hypothetical protein [Rhizobium sp. GN54]
MSVASNREPETVRPSLQDYPDQQASSGISSELTAIVAALAKASLEVADRQESSRSSG